MIFRINKFESKTVKWQSLKAHLKINRKKGKINMSKNCDSRI